jgi:UDP-GlcNAc:undecaprenyl-phosphate GlcNAc-1-phosphate transferase
LSIPLALGLAGLSCAAAAFALTPLIAFLSRRAGVVDASVGRERGGPVPLLGGVAVFLALGLGGVAYGLAFGWQRLFDMMGSEHHLSLLIPAAMVFLVGVVDDVRGVPPLAKIVCQAMAAIVAMQSGLVIDRLWTPFGGVALPAMVSYPLTLLWFIGVTNAFNLVDGLDGLLASVGAAAMLGVAGVALSVSQTGTAFLPAAVACALLGFLPWNWHKARVFLGDSGSLLVGFLAAALSLKVGRYTDGIAFHVMLALCFVPAFETFLSLARRYVSGRPFFSGDRGHLHHVLVRRKGLSVGRAVVVLAFVQVLFAGIAVVSRIRLGWWAAAPATGLLLVAAALIRWVDYAEFHVLWHRFIRNLLHPTRRSLASVVGLAAAGRRIRAAATAAELSGALKAVREDLGLSFMAVEFTESGRRAVGDFPAPAPLGNESARRYLAGLEGASCWIFSGEERETEDAEPPPCGQTLAFAVPGWGESGYGRLVCHIERDADATFLRPEDVGRYLAAPLGEALRRLGRAEGRDDAVAARADDAGG